MARARKLTPAAVRTIFKSTGPASQLGSQFGVSTNLIYLIRSGRVHKHITSKMTAPPKRNGRRRAAATAESIDMNALADAIIDRFMARLFARSGR